MVQPSVPWPVLSQRLAYLVGPITGGPSGVIGRSPHQKLALRHVAAVGVEVGDHMLQRRAPGRSQLRVVAVELGHAADPDPVAEPGDRDLVGLVHDRRSGAPAGSVIGTVIE